MLVSPRIGTKNLAGLCRRLGTALEAGIDVRKALATEATRGRPRTLAAVLHELSEAVARGDTIAETVAARGDYFPPLFRQLVEVGEQTGHLAEVLLRLADHYENQVRLRRLFLGAITWPLAELVIAVFVVGLLILVVGVIGSANNTKIDPLGLGLVGVPGLAVYVACVAGVSLVVAIVIYGILRGVAWVRPIQYLVVRVPALGGALQTLAIARMAWTLHLTLNTEIDVRRAIRLALESTHDIRFTDPSARVDASLEQGNSIAESLAEADSFPPEFLAAVSVGEQSGNLVESMALLSHQYQDRARAAMATLTTLAGVAVWVVIAALIVAVIFRLAFFYVDTINRAVGGF